MTLHTMYDAGEVWHIALVGRQLAGEKANGQKRVKVDLFQSSDIYKDKIHMIASDTRKLVRK
jgi:hypothetical protein